MKRITVFSSLAIVAATSFFPGCSDDESSPSTPVPADDAGTDGAVTIRDLGAPNIPCSDSADSLYGDPGALPAGNGEIIKCHEDPVLSQDGVQAALAAVGYAGKPVTSGARVYRVLFRTERGDPANTPASSTALVYIPTVPRANDLPIVVGARGSRGQGPECAASKRKPNLGVNRDLDRLAYSIVGQGYAVIVPDLPGYSNYGAAGNPPSAYNDARDVGKGTLDGSKALKKLYPKLADKTVLVGLSQGGHTALAALALAESYGVQGKLSAVATYAPLWFSQRTWGAVLNPGIAQTLNVTFKDSAAASAITIWYHYTKAELLDGKGEGEKLFRADARATIKQFVENQCWDQAYPALEALGTYAYEVFDQSMIDSVGDAAAFGTCPVGNALCDKWLARYVADRPKLTGSALSVPIMFLYGGKDTELPPNRARCALDKLSAEGTSLSVCYEPEGEHGAMINIRGDHVADWIAQQTLGGPAPSAPCPGGAEAVTTACATPPPND